MRVSKQPAKLRSSTCLTTHHGTLSVDSSDMFLDGNFGSLKTIETYLSFGPWKKTLMVMD
jgi:hypothetical protein